MAQEIIYLSKNNGTEVNVEGWTRLKELSNFVLDAEVDKEDVDNIYTFVGGGYETRYANEFNALYSAFNVNGKGGLALSDATNPRFAMYLDNFRTNTESTSEHYNDMYVTYDTDTKQLDIRGGLSISDTEASNLIVTEPTRFAYSALFADRDLVTPTYALEHIIGEYNPETRLLVNNTFDTYENYVMFAFDTSAPLFLRYEDAKDYIETGRTKNCINEMLAPVEPETDDSLEYYIKSITYRLDSNKENKTVVGSNNDYFKCNGYKICGYVTKDNPYNIRLVCNKVTSFNLMYPYIKHKRGLVGEWEELTAEQVEALTGWTWSETRQTSNGFVYGSLTTNIPIARDKLTAQLISQNVIDESLALKQDTPTKATADYKIGIPIVDQKTDISEATYKSDGFSTQYIQDSLRDISNILYSEGEVLDALKNSTQVYQNPIDVLVDCYAVPFNPRDFVDGGTVSVIRVGNRDFEAHGTPFKVTRYGKLKTLVNTSIDALLGDFRDYEYVSAKLYLPYVATIDFNYKAYIGTLLTIKASFDAKSHTLKYYLFSDNKLIETYANTVGMDICVTGVDYASKQQGLRNSLSNVLGSTINIATSALTGNAGGVVSSAINAFEGVYEANKSANRPSDIRATGSIGDGTAFNDINYIYIIFDIQETEIPKDLYKLYGKPSNYYGRLGVLSGFTQVDKLRLYTTATAEEQNEIQELCKGGIII